MADSRELARQRIGDWERGAPTLIKRGTRSLSPTGPVPPADALVRLVRLLRAARDLRERRGR